MGGSPRVSLAQPGFSPRVLFTEEGGLAVRLTNKTGAATVKGTLVGASAGTNLAFEATVADGLKPIGVVYENGIADGQEAWVVVAGLVDVLLQDSTAATRDYWARTSSTVAGRADITSEYPPGGTVQALEIHGREIGHCLQSVVAGTSKLARIMLHFN